MNSTDHKRNIQLYRKGVRNGIKLAMEKATAQQAADAAGNSSGDAQVGETPTIDSLYGTLVKHLAAGEADDLKYNMKGERGGSTFATHTDTPGPPKLLCTNDRQAVVPVAPLDLGQSTEGQSSQSPDE